MYEISFIFRPGEYDDDFHRLDAEIDAIAQGTPGYIGSQTWYSEDRKVLNAVYGWEHLDNLKDFSRSAAHLQAKSEYQRWYLGYEVVVAEVISRYGDGRL
ncbi:MAG TPA: antibiotic biosynthesis monooxygenase [Actinomycetota bacterium]|nr:MAG: antibiotic biosynthesis monooxygenase [Actinomycetota bacterium]HNL52173.1 antibiotic biosynthesis monooxygenase [Actinomycetota bacterium]HUM86968.1 antibiotic biosynthesis monooxygenase [Actinomycetota bacterium]